jgi:hypothetical protein
VLRDENHLLMWSRGLYARFDALGDLLLAGPIVAKL